MMTLWGDAREVRWAALLLALMVTGVSARGQGALPATTPTSGQSVSQLPSPNPPVQRLASHLVVLWDGVALRVEARNVSLNAVLHEIALKTKMKVTGSAPDERVFGSYGPGPVNLVVPSLLNGVAVNLLLPDREGGAADELVITDRNGGATPSYIPTQQDAQGGTSPAPPQYFGRVPQEVPRGPGRRSSAPGGALLPNGNDPVIPDNGINGRDNGISGPNNGQNGTDNGINGGNNGLNGTDNGLNNSNSAANNAPVVNGGVSTDSGPASPNGVRTPQEIFEQLQRLRAQQNQQ